MSLARSSSVLAAALALVIVLSKPAQAQSTTTVAVVGANLRVRSPGFEIIEGRALRQLRDGRALSVEVRWDVRSKPEGPVVTERLQRFDLSYDLWEERFAVSSSTSPPRSSQHRRTLEVAAWCLEQLGIPLSSLAALGRRVPFWVRLEYRILDARPRPDDGGGDSGFGLRALIDRLSPRAQEGAGGRALVAGPFQLPE